MSRRPLGFVELAPQLKRARLQRAFSGLSLPARFAIMRRKRRISSF